MLKKRLFRVVLALVPTAIGTLIFFPWHTEASSDSGAAKAYFGEVFQDPAEGSRETPPAATNEVQRQPEVRAEVHRRLKGWIDRLHLANAKVLEAGAGDGSLQDLVPDYTGLDISATARRFFHKPFVEASATEMPFPDAHFDALWSIWVLEHIPSPEKALAEMRRVVKPGGYLILQPAYDVSRWASRGYPVRPFSELGLQGKLTKATLALAEQKPFSFLYRPAINLARYAGSASGPTTFHFTRLNPNYKQYWMSDSDATTSFSHFEVELWFRSRGDRCMNCASGPLARLLEIQDPMIVLRKSDR